MQELKWPPIREELRRLYEDEKLSAAKIACRYGLMTDNPKSSETLVLYHLRKFGIKRRDRAEHIRKVTDGMIEEWVRRYEAGVSLTQIAGDDVDPVTVFNYLKRRGVQLRDKVEAQIEAVSKYTRRSFGGDKLEKAYLMGLRYGDLHAVRHGRAVRVRVSTTHPAMADLFDGLFSPYGHVSRYPRKARLAGHEWSLECDLNDSFQFLLAKLDISSLETMSRYELISFMAGLFDAEGSILLHKKKKWLNPEASISNSDPQLIDFAMRTLRGQGYRASVRWNKQKLDRRGVAGQSLMGRVEILRFEEAQEFVRMLPIRHAEKLARRDLVLGMRYRSPAQSASKLVANWRATSNRIRGQVSDFVEAARVALGRDEHADSCQPG